VSDYLWEPLYACLGFWVPICITLHLAALNFNCQQSDQFAISFRFLCSLRQSSHDSMVLYSFVSCAYICMLQSSRQEMSLTNRIKRHGPSTLPWGIPLCTSAQFERLLLTKQRRPTIRQDVLSRMLFRIRQRKLQLKWGMSDDTYYPSRITLVCSYSGKIVTLRRWWIANA
jgi:hypothetical protein